MPASIELSAMEVSLVNTMNREIVLQNYLNEVKSKYDYVLIDCMSSLGMITVNTLATVDPYQKYRALVWCAFHFNFPTMHIHDPFDNRQPKSAAAAVTGLIGTVESIKNQRQFLRHYTDTIIRNSNEAAVTLVLRFYPNMAARSAVFDRVAH